MRNLAPLREATDEKRGPWSHGLRLNAKSKPKTCVANAMHVLATHPAWKGVIAYDAFAECIVCVAEPPTRRQDAPGASMLGDWTDAHSTRTAAWIASEADFDVTPAVVEQAVAVQAAKKTVHPVRDYLRAQVWDGKARLDLMLHRYFGVIDSPYSRAVGARWMISAVARIMRPGCQVDCMLVLEGAQGQRKSTGLEALCEHPEWFADTGISIGDKDSYQSLRRKWIYEFGELDSIKGREVTRVKNFVSARSDNYRPSYGRRNQDFPRQVVFAGTTNEDQYLADRTGNRRFWPVKCLTEVDVAAIRRDRGQLWAEARARFENGEPWHVDTPELVKLCQAEQVERQAPDDWVPIVAKWLESPTIPDTDSTPREPRRTRVDITQGITTADALLGAIAMRPADINSANTTRMGRVLRDCGLLVTKNPLRRGGDRARRYYLPEHRPSVAAE